MKINVPKGMPEAACAGRADAGKEWMRDLIEGTVRWVSENPIVTAFGDCQRMWNETGYGNGEDPQAALKRHQESQARIIEAYRRGVATRATELEGKL